MATMTATLGQRTRRQHPRAGKWALSALLLAIVVVVDLPIIMMVLNSLRRTDEILSGGLLPRAPSLDNYLYLNERTPFWTYFGNSVVVAFGATAMTIVVAAFGGLLPLAVSGAGDHRLLATAVAGADVPADPDVDSAVHPVSRVASGQHANLGSPPLFRRPSAIRDLDVQGLLRRDPARVGGGGPGRRIVADRRVLADCATAVRPRHRRGDHLLAPLLLQRIPGCQHLPARRGEDDHSGWCPDVHAAVPDRLGQPHGGRDPGDVANGRLSCSSCRSRWSMGRSPAPSRGNWLKPNQGPTDPWSGAMRR